MASIAITPPIPAVTYEEDPIQASASSDPGNDSSPWNVLTDVAGGVLEGIAATGTAVASAQIAQAGGYNVPNLGAYPFSYGSGATGGVKVAPGSTVKASAGPGAALGLGGLVVIGLLAWLILK